MNAKTQRGRLTLAVMRALHKIKAVNKKNKIFNNESSRVSGASSKRKKESL